MKITYALWQGSRIVGIDLKASKMSEIIAVIKDLNTGNTGSIFSHLVTKIEEAK